MTTQIVRVGNALMVEIPEELVAQVGFQVGEPLQWIVNGIGSISLVRSADASDADEFISAHPAT